MIERIDRFTNKGFLFSTMNWHKLTYFSSIGPKLLKIEFSPEQRKFVVEE